MLKKYYSSEFVAFVQQVDTPETEDIDVWENDCSAEGMTTGKGLSVAQCGQVQTLMRKYSKVWSKVPGRTEKVAHSVETGSAHPIRQPTYRIPQAHKAEVVAEIEKMREVGVIVPSVSQWSSPIVPVRKKDGSLRICIDYRKLNAVSRMDACPVSMTSLTYWEKLATSQHLIWPRATGKFLCLLVRAKRLPSPLPWACLSLR